MSTCAACLKRRVEEPDVYKRQPHHWVMVIDQSKCVGCDLCLAACHAYNDTPPTISWSRVEEVEPTADGRRVFRPTPCMHCEDAPCVEICPVGATYHRYDGLVMMDYERCIGCRYCQLSCPYGVRHFNWEAFTGANPDVPAAGHPEAVSYTHLDVYKRQPTTHHAGAHRAELPQNAD